MSAILNLGHIPAGMELFTANDTSQWETIKQWIDESDVYMLILGGRYGSIEEKSGLSYTELEYDYALRIKKPLFAVVLHEHCISTIAKERGLEFIEREHTQKLSEFKEKVLRNMCSFYEDIKDIQICVMKSLPRIDSKDSLSGWISGRDVSDTKALVDEISGLRKENKELQNQLENVLKNPINNSQNENLTELLEIFSLLKYKVPDENVKSITTEYTLLEILQEYEGLLIKGVSEESCSNHSSSFIFKNVFPKLELYDLVFTPPQQLTNDLSLSSREFRLTELGREFIKFNEKRRLLTR